MSSTNLGNQYLTFDYKHPAKASDFNTALRGVVKPGFHTGGALSIITSGTQISIATFTAFLNVDTTKLLRVETRTTVVLTPTPSLPNMYMSYTWADTADNWVDFKCVASDYTPTANEVFIGTAIFTASTITSTSITGRDYTFYQYGGNLSLGSGQLISNLATGTAPFTIASQTLVTNLNADKFDGADLSTDSTLSAVSDVLVPTQKAVKDYVTSQTGGSVTFLFKRSSYFRRPFAELALKRWGGRLSPADNNWSSVVWSTELQLFCAVATGGQVATSPDGAVWTLRTAASANSWTSVCWSSNVMLFVAVANSGTGNRVMTSPDGITWTSRTSSIDNNWTSVCWAQEKSLFVAVANSGTSTRVMTSPNGIDWTTRTSAADNNWTSVVWANNILMFVAVANSGTGNRVMTSPDGTTWTSRTSAADNSWNSIVWSSDLSTLVAVASSGTGNRVMTSTNGVTWTSRISAADNDWQGICWSQDLGIFVAVANTGTGTRVMTSYDGIKWVKRINLINNNWTSVAWAPEIGLFLAVGNSGTGNRMMASIPLRLIIGG